MRSRVIFWNFWTLGVLGLSAGFSQTGQNQPKPEHVIENPQQGVQPYRKHFEREGIAVDIAIDHVDPVNKVPGYFTEGDSVKIGFTITDTATAAPLINAYPAGWLDLIPAGEVRSEENCTGKLKAFLAGGLFGTPEINLNEYYVIALNQDATLTVVDPVFGFGGTKLLAMVQLDSPGGDWALLSDQSRLFVSMPEADKLAVIDTGNWRLRTRLDTGPHPVNTLLQPDEHYLWSAFLGKPGEPGGVAVFNTNDLTEAARFTTGAGEHDLAIDEINRFAYVSNRDAGTVSVIDIRGLRKLVDLPAGGSPVSLAYSALAQAVYVACDNGQITVIDGAAAIPAVAAKLSTEAGLGPIRFAPGGRFAFVLNPALDQVQIIDATKQRIIQTGQVLDQPDQVCFSDNLAYIRHRGSETMLMISLVEIGVEGKPVAVVDLPVGQLPPTGTGPPTPAAGVVQAPGASAILVSNAPDEAIFYYKEGMAAPMGQFANYSHQPRAVLVVDRSLKEHTRPGLYETFIKFDKPGLYDLVFFMDSPRLAQCFAVTVAPDAALQSERDKNRVAVRFFPKEKVVPVAQQVDLDFSIVDQVSGMPLRDLADVTVLVNLQPGTWHHSFSASNQGDGTYRISFTPPTKGFYYLYAASPTVELSYNNSYFLVMRAGPAKHAAAPKGLPIKPREKTQGGTP